MVIAESRRRRAGHFSRLAVGIKNDVKLFPNEMIDTALPYFLPVRSSG